VPSAANLASQNFLATAEAIIEYDTVSQGDERLKIRDHIDQEGARLLRRTRLRGAAGAQGPVVDRKNAYVWRKIALFLFRERCNLTIRELLEHSQENQSVNHIPAVYNDRGQWMDVVLKEIVQETLSDNVGAQKLLETLDLGLMSAALGAGADPNTPINDIQAGRKDGEQNPSLRAWFLYRCTTVILGPPSAVMAWKMARLMLEFSADTDLVLEVWRDVDGANDTQILQRMKVADMLRWFVPPEASIELDRVIAKASRISAKVDLMVRRERAVHSSRPRDRRQESGVLM
jgi:hypothetical protein